RTLCGAADTRRPTAQINHIGQGEAITDTGFAFRADFRKPDWWLPSQDGRLSAEVLREVLPAYNRKAIDFAAGIDRIISPVWTVRAGLYFEIEQAQRPSSGIWQDYTLIGVPGSVLLQQANSHLGPTKGKPLGLHG